MGRGLRMTQSAPVQTDVLHFIVEDTAQNMWAVQMIDSGTLTDFWTLMHRNSGLSATVYDAFSAGVLLDCWDTPLVNVCIDDRHIILKYRCTDHEVQSESDDEPLITAVDQLAFSRFTLQVGISNGGTLSLKTFQQMELAREVV
jgi:hypothetical protein